MLKLIVRNMTAVLFLVATLYAGYGQTGFRSEVKPTPFGVFRSGTDDSITINAAFTPDGHTVYFSKSHAGWVGLTIFESHLQGNRWSKPMVAPFSGIFRDTDPAVSPDGKRLVFASMRDANGNAVAKYSLFQVALPFSKGAPIEPLGVEINNGGNILYPSFSADGSLYFIRNIDKVARMFRSTYLDGRYTAPEMVTLPGDSPTVFDSDPTIAPDQSFIVFVSNRPDSLGSNDLYISFREGEKWCSPIHFEEPINSAQAELATGLSPDGKTLYFTSSRMSVKQPRTARATAETFQAEAADYENGVPRLFQADLSDWIVHHQLDKASCGVIGSPR